MVYFLWALLGINNYKREAEKRRRIYDLHLIRKLAASNKRDEVRLAAKRWKAWWFFNGPHYETKRDEDAIIYIWVTLYERKWHIVKDILDGYTLEDWKTGRWKENRKRRIEAKKKERIENE